MAEPEKPTDKTAPTLQDEEKMQERVAYYAALVNAWISTRMELDKSIMTLSAGAIGLLITLLSTSDNVTLIDIILSAISMAFFIITILACLVILKGNSAHIEDVRNQKVGENKTLAKLDRYAAIFFMHGLIFAMVFSLVNVSHKYNARPRKEVKTMSKNMRNDSSGSQKNSVNGVGRLSPDATSGSQTTSSSGATGNQDKSTSSSQAMNK